MTEIIPRFNRRKPSKPNRGFRIGTPCFFENPHLEAGLPSIPMHGPWNVCVKSEPPVFLQRFCFCLLLTFLLSGDKLIKERNNLFLFFPATPQKLGAGLISRFFSPWMREVRGVAGPILYCSSKGSIFLLRGGHFSGYFLSGSEGKNKLYL